MSTTATLKPNEPRFLPVLKGLATALLSAFLLAFLLGSIFYFSPLSEAYLPFLSLLILVGSTFFGGYRAARLGGGKGLQRGLAVGLLVFLAVFLITCFWTPESLIGSNFFKTLFYLSAAGGLGGISGVIFQR